MTMEILGVIALCAALAAPFAVDRFLRSLPVAPACPGCRAVTQAVTPISSLWRLLPAPVVVTLSECARCGWRGPMRWRWARRSVRENRG